MKKLLASLSFALLLSQAFAQLKFDVLVNDTKVGTAEMTERMLTTGGKQVVLTMILTTRGKEARVRQESVYDMKGVAVRKIMEVVQGRSERTLTVVTFGPRTAHVQTTSTGKTETKDYPVSPEVPLENPSEYWFRGETPKPGERAVYYAFSLSDMGWHLEETTFVGPAEFTLGGNKVSGFQVKMRKGSAILDDKGMPLQIENEGMKMVRVP